MTNTKSVIFRMAHKLTRDTLEIFSGASYQATFAASLKLVIDYVKRSGHEYVYSFVSYTVPSRLNDVLEERVGIVTMHYSEYKRDYEGCQTVKDSYDKRKKTIKVYTMSQSTCSNVKMTVKGGNGRCRFCGTWCYGDCQA